MKNDFLEEIWRVREKLAARFDYDLHRMVVHLQREQAKHGHALVRAPKPFGGSNRALQKSAPALREDPPHYGNKPGRKT
jgi:hypothetical protein